MKKILMLSLSLILISVAASAQQDNVGDHSRRHRIERSFNNHQLNRPERHQLRRDHLRYKIAQRRARRDGFVGPVERRRLHNMRRHDRHELFRFRHNRHHRVI